VAGFLQPVPQIYEAFAFIAFFYLYVNYTSPDETNRERFFDGLERRTRWGSLRWFHVIQSSNTLVCWRLTQTDDPDPYFPSLPRAHRNYNIHRIHRGQILSTFKQTTQNPNHRRSDPVGRRDRCGTCHHPVRKTHEGRAKRTSRIAQIGHVQGHNFH
jgi:hypothetical protein